MHRLLVSQFIYDILGIQLSFSNKTCIFNLSTMVYIYYVGMCGLHRCMYADKLPEFNHIGIMYAIDTCCKKLQKIHSL